MRKLALCGAILTIVIVQLWTSNSSVAKQAPPPKPRMAVLEFKNKADNQWWYHGGAAAAQDVFVTEIVKSGKFDVLSREKLNSLERSKNLTLSGDVDPKTAVKIGKLLGVNYLLTGAVTEYGVTDKGTGTLNASKRKFAAAMSAKLIDTSTGEVVWAKDARNETDSVKVSVGGMGGGVDDSRMFNLVMKPCIQQLTASLKAADL